MLLLPTLSSTALSAPRQTDREAKIRAVLERYEAAKVYIGELEAREKTQAAALQAAREAVDACGELTRVQAERLKLAEDALALTKQQATDARAEAERLQTELVRVREERDDARRSRWTVGAVALLVGALIGFAAADH